MVGEGVASSSLRLMPAARRRVSVRLLGRFTLSRDGRELPVHDLTPRPAALLRMLAASGGRLPREVVMDALWPESDPDAAATNVRTLLHRLRLFLGDDPPPALSQGGAVMLNPAIDWDIDVEAFERGLDQAEDNVDALESALRLFGGEPLPDNRYDDWATPMRERLQRRYREGVLRLADRLDVDGRGAPASRWLERLLEHDPLDEVVLRRLLQTFGGMSRRSDAVRAYARFSHRLRTELDLDPEDETQALMAAIAGAPTSRPPVEDDARQASPLPPQPTSFIGRETEIRDVAALFRKDRARLVTLTGAGGSGKTRLALRVAEEVAGAFPDGIVFVPLASLVDSSQVPGAIASALGIESSAGTDVTRKIINSLFDRHLVLLLDNCEHVLSGCAIAGELLAACPELTILATSRERLHLSGEQQYLVPPMGIPVHGSTAGTEWPSQSDAVALFRDRARAVQPGFVLSDDDVEVVAEICRRLDGLPLAIELAAARIHLLPLHALLARLIHPLDLLSKGPQDAPQRHQAMRAAIDWSFQFLDAGERRLFTRLAIFRGGATFDAAMAICGSDVFDDLSALLEKNLVYLVENPGGSRVALLETIREYAREYLAGSGDEEQIGRNHATYFLATAERLDCAIDGLVTPVRSQQLLEDSANIDAAVTWFGDRGEWSNACRLVAAISVAWVHSNQEREFRRWMALVWPHRDRAPDPVRATLLIFGVLCLGDLVSLPPSLEECTNLCRALECEALAILRAGGDEEHLYHALMEMVGHDLYHTTYWFQNDLALAEARLNEAIELTRAANRPERLGAQLRVRGELAKNLHGKPRQAWAWFEESLDAERAISSHLGVAFSLHALAFVAYDLDDYDATLAFAQDAIDAYRGSGGENWSDPISHLRVLCGCMDLRLGAGERLGARIREARSDAPRNPWDEASWLEMLARWAADSNRLTEAALLLGAADAAAQRLDRKRASILQRHLGIDIGIPQCRESVRERLGQFAWQSAWREGQKLSLAQALGRAPVDELSVSTTVSTYLHSPVR